MEGGRRGGLAGDAASRSRQARLRLHHQVLHSSSLLFSPSLPPCLPPSFLHITDFLQYEIVTPHDGHDHRRGLVPLQAYPEGRKKGFGQDLREGRKGRREGRRGNGRLRRNAEVADTSQ